MRVRILKQSTGVVDGVSLRALLPDLTYDLRNDLAEYLIATDAAQEVPAIHSARDPLTDDEGMAERLTAGVKINQPPLTQAADRSRRRRKRR